jgi:hypothetical protein
MFKNDILHHYPLNIFVLLLLYYYYCIKIPSYKVAEKNTNSIVRTFVNRGLVL